MWLALWFCWAERLAKFLRHRRSSPPSSAPSHRMFFPSSQLTLSLVCILQKTVKLGKLRGLQLFRQLTKQQYSGDWKTGAGLGTEEGVALCQLHTETKGKTRFGVSRAASMSESGSCSLNIHMSTRPLYLSTPVLPGKIV